MRTAFICFQQLAGLDGLGLEHGLEVGVLIGDIAFEFGGEGSKLDQVREAQPGARDLVFVGRSDAEPGGTDRILAQVRLAAAVNRPMIRHHHVRIVAELEGTLAAQMGVGPQIVDFLDQGEGIDHGAVANHAGLAGMQRSGRNQPQDELLPVHDQGMGGVVATLKAHHDIGVGGQQVHDLAFALVTPLCADYGHCLHAIADLDARRAPVTVCGRATAKSTAWTCFSTDFTAHAGDGVIRA